MARRIGRLANGRVHLHARCAEPGFPEEIVFESIRDLLASTFSHYPAHIFVGAAGIAVRAIAPHLQSKDTDPCVVAMDQDGMFCVSLLSGHLGGGNALARDIADMVGAQPVITTATDRQAVPAIDLLAQQAGLGIGNIQAVKLVSGHLLDGGKAALFDPDDHLQFSQRPDLAAYFQPTTETVAADAPCAVWVDYRVRPSAPGHLLLHPKNISVGIGCRRDTPCQEILDHLRTVFAAQGLHTDSIAGLASIDAKQDEPGLLEAARELGVPVTFYPPEKLQGVDVPNPSDRVQQHMGVESVCEAAALTLAANKQLIVPKTKSPRVTLAAAC